MSLTSVERRHAVRTVLAGAGAGRPSIRVSWVDTTYRALVGEAQSVVVVVGAHRWAGASTVAVALADAAGSPGEPTVVRRGGLPEGLRGEVRLVDAASRESSGLGYVANRELGVGDDHCLVGRRGPVEVRRATSPVSTPAEITLPMPYADGVVVVDAAWDLPTLIASAGWPEALLTRAPLVLVSRATVPGVRAAEVALSQIARDDVLVALVGARRLPGVVSASTGPRLRQAHHRRQLVCFSHDRRLALEGLDDRPMSRGLLASAGRLWGSLSAGDRTVTGAGSR